MHGRVSEDRSEAEDRSSHVTDRSSRVTVRRSSWPMWVLGLVIMIDQVDQNIVRGVATPLKDHFHLSDLQLGILLSSFIAVNGLVSVPAGYLADRWNRTRTVGHTVVAWSAITALTAAAWNYPVLLAVRSALGFGQAITEPSAGSLLADYYPHEERGGAFSIQQCLVFVGFGLGIGLGGLVGEAFGWRAAFLVVGSPGVLIALAVYRLEEPRRGHSDRVHLGVEDVDRAGEVEHHALFDEGFRAFVRNMNRGLRDDLKVILAIPTMVAGIYGMNFKFIPELNWHWGYPFILGLTFTLCVIVFFLFRRSGWL